MLPRPSFIAERRQEPELKKLWGLYCAAEDRWLPVTFQHRQDASEAERIVNGRGVVRDRR